MSVKRVYVVMILLFTVIAGSCLIPSEAAAESIFGSRMLSRGNRGNDVLQLQQYLRQAGLSIRADGIYGPATQASVRRFQMRHNLPMTGVAGAQTMRALVGEQRQFSIPIYEPSVHTVVRRHRVVAGDTLSELALHYGTRVNDLRRLNQIEGDRIFIGQTLLVPGSEGTAADDTASVDRLSSTAQTVEVKAGDTLWGIANRFSISVLALREANQLKNDVIYPGQELRLPPEPSQPLRQTPGPGVRETFEGKVILIDPGHGHQQDRGTRGLLTGVWESDLNWDLALRLQERLKRAGARAVLSRKQNGDVPLAHPGTGTRDLARRVARAEQVNAHVYLSLHANWSDDPSVRGILAFYAPGSSPGEQLANDIQKAVIEATPLPAAGAPRAERYYVVRHTTMPAVLVETGFLSNVFDEEYLTTAANRDALADALFNGIQQFLSRKAT